MVTPINHYIYVSTTIPIKHSYTLSFKLISSTILSFSLLVMATLTKNDCCHDKNRECCNSKENTKSKRPTQLISTSNNWKIID